MDAIAFTFIKTVIIYSIILLIVYLHGRMKKQLLDCYSFSDDSSIAGTFSAELRSFLTMKKDVKKYFTEIIVVTLAVSSFLFFPFSDSILINGKTYLLNIVDTNYAPVVALLLLSAAVIINVLSTELIDEYALKKSNIIKFQNTFILTVTMIFGILGLYMTLDGSSYNDLVSGQRSVDSYFFFQRPVNGIITFIVIVFITANTDEEQRETHLRSLVMSNRNKLMPLIFNKILKISLVLNFTYFFLGGHSIIPPLGHLSKIGELSLCISQILSLVIKSTLMLFVLEWINLRFEKLKDVTVLEYSLKYFVPGLIFNEVFILWWSTI